MKFFLHVILGLVLRTAGTFATGFSHVQGVAEPLSVLTFGAFDTILT